jgi:hypothetical protein
LVARAGWRRNDSWQYSLCDLLAPHFEAEPVDVPHRVAQPGGERLVLVDRKILLLELIPPFLRAVEHDRGHPFRLSGGDRQPAARVELHGFHEARAPLVHDGNGIALVPIFHEQRLELLRRLIQSPVDAVHVADQELHDALCLSGVPEIGRALAALHVPHPTDPLARHDQAGADDDCREGPVELRDVHRLLEPLCVDQELVQLFDFCIVQRIGVHRGALQKSARSA